MGDVFSNIDIVNRALLELGGAESVNWLADLSNESLDLVAQLRVLLPSSLKEILNIFKWPEAEIFLDLGAEVTGSSRPESGDWGYVFPLPANLLRVYEQIWEPDTANMTPSCDCRYQKHFNAVPCHVLGRYLLTNHLTNLAGDSAYIWGGQYLQDSALMSSALQQTWVLKLAALLAPKYHPDRAEVQEAKFNAYLRTEAARHCGADQPERPGTWDERKFSWVNQRAPGVQASDIGLSYPGY